MRLKVSKKFSRSLEPVRFAERHCRAFAKHPGLPWKLSCRIEAASGSAWSGRAWGWKGEGRVYLCLPLCASPQWHVDPRFSNTPGYYLSGTDEVIVFLAGHEFGHVIGYDGDKAGEVARDKLGYAAVLAWRAREDQWPACLI